MYYVFDYNAKGMFRLEKLDEGGTAPDLARAMRRLRINDITDLDQLANDGPVLKALAGALGVSADAITKDTVAAALIAIPVGVVESIQPPKPEKKSGKKKSKKDLPVSTDTATSSSPEGTTPADETKEGQMAAQKKKTVKSKAKAKSAKAKKATVKGQPKAGSKKAKLLALVSRPGGATMAEMLKTTGWKACLGTAKAVATAAGLKFNIVKDPEGKKASRWEAKK